MTSVSPVRHLLGGASRTASISVVGDAASVHVSSRAAALATLGYDVTLITPREGRGVTCRQACVDRYLAGRPPRRGICRRLAWISAVRALFAAHRGIATHIHYAQGLWAGLGLILGARPLIVTVMGGDILFGEQVSSSWADRALTRLLLRHADLVTAKSEHLARVVRSFGIPDNRVMTLYWGVDSALFRPLDGTNARHELGLSPDNLVLLSPRFLRPLYNVDKIIDSMPLIRAGARKVKLLVIDYGPDLEYRTTLLRRVSELGLERDVILLPPRARERMPEIYAACDIVVSVPSSDGMPMTVLEAMACGKPIVVTDLHQYRELLVGGVNVITCSATAEGIAQAIGRIATQPELAHQLAQNAIRTITERADLRTDLVRLNERLVELIDGRMRRQSIAVRGLAIALWTLCYVQQVAQSIFKPRPGAA